MLADYFQFLGRELYQIGQSIVHALPRVLGAFIIILVTILLAKLIKIITIKVLRLLGINVFSKKAGIDDWIKPIELTQGVAELVGIIVYWLFIFLGITYALSTAGLQPAQALLANFMLVLPRVFIAIVIFIIGLHASVFLGNVTYKACLGMHLTWAKTIGQIVRIVVLLVTFVSIIEELALNLDFLKVFLYILIGATAGLGLITFGIGGIQFAKDFLASKTLKTMLNPGMIITTNQHHGTVLDISQVVTRIQSDQERIVVIRNTDLLQSPLVIKEPEHIKE